MYNFCTLFDSGYLTRGLALYYSLVNTCADFHLYIFAFDNKSLEILSLMNLENATIIPLKDFEDENLLKVKQDRSKGEYCWTCTASVILYTLKKYHLDMCTYLDSDIFFYNSPETLLNEIGNKSVIITEHRFSKKYISSIEYGKYCVQFMTFKNNHEGLEVLNWWRNACIQWCYDKKEEYRYGDQKYLDDWTQRFSCVYELKNLGGGVAPWNIQQYELLKNENQFMDKMSKKKFTLVFYHFQGLKFYKDGNISLAGGYELSKQVKEFIYKPYIVRLEEIKKSIQIKDNTFDPHGSSDLIKNWKWPIIALKLKINKSYNFYKKDRFING